MTDIVVSIDLRSAFGPARNQGPRPTCMAFAASDAHAGFRKGWAPLSCEYAFYQAQRRTGRPPNKGALLSSMLDALREDGQPEEGSWPYLPATPVDAASWVPPANVGEIFCCAGEKSPASIDQVIGELNQCRPVIILLMLSRAFYRPAAQGAIYPAAGEAPESSRRHAVIAVGHGKVDADQAILVRNSWGERWGDGGYGW